MLETEFEVMPVNYRKKEEILERLTGKEYLGLVEYDVLSIAQRLNEYDENLFLVFNIKKQKYEVHSLANIGDTFCLEVPYKELDARVLELVKKNDQRNRRLKDIIWEMDKKNEEKAKLEERYYNGEIKAAAKEVRPIFKKMAEELY